MCAVVPRKWSEGPQKGPEIDKLSSPVFPPPDDDVASSIQNITNLEEQISTSLRPEYSIRNINPIYFWGENTKKKCLTRFPAFAASLIRVKQFAQSHSAN